ncbi:MAG: hypothetical protein R6U97_01435, partial [Desulfosalsimonas sp.]
MVITVDAKARPFNERLELEVRIDDNLILHASARALNVQSMEEAEVHNLEFGLMFPVQHSRLFDASGPDTLAGETSKHEVGGL